MDIRLRARLSAYSKVDSISSSCNVPVPDVVDSGSVLGVNEEGQYTFFKNTKHEDVDELFTDTDLTTFVTKEEINSLFENVVADPTVPQESDQLVTKEDIDKLF